MAQKVSKTGKSVSCDISGFSVRRALAAQLIAADTLTDEQIARTVGISRRTLARWKKAPDVAALVRSIVREHAQWCREQWEEEQKATRQQRWEQFHQRMQ